MLLKKRERERMAAENGAKKRQAKTGSKERGRGKFEYVIVKRNALRNLSYYTSARFSTSLPV
jgi:hypothetical protein